MDVVKNQEIINKVMAVAVDEKVVAEILQSHNKENETVESHIEGIEMRVKMLCRKAAVNYNDYLEALGTSTKGYSVVLRRDIDELFINPYNREWTVSYTHLRAHET